MDTTEVIKLAATLAASIGGGLVALARWYSARTSARDAQEGAERAREVERADKATATLIEELRRRIVWLEEEMRRLQAESCAVKGCLERRSKA